MTEPIQKPVIFLAFAQDRTEGGAYLRNLPIELDGIRKALQKARQAGLCEVVERSNTTVENILDVFQEYRDRIAVFHYGGHADSYELLLESLSGEHAMAHSEGLVSFLAKQKGLQLIFLNGCCSQQQALDLIEAGLPAVVGTSQKIDDEIATNLSGRFYKGLAVGLAIDRAWAEAVDQIKVEKGTSNTRALHWKGKVEVTDRFPWEIYYRPGAESVAQWSLPEAAGDPLFGLPPIPISDLPEKPFRHLHWFEREHAEVFFGRHHQIRALYERVIAPHTAPIILLYGQSGVGKSSLLAAGLIPRLEGTHEIYYLRRDQKLGLSGTLNQALLPNAKVSSLAEAWPTLEQQRNRPLLVILDQVEEVYTRPNGEQPNEWQEFLEALQATFADPSRRPQGKLILGFRKEWLAEIDKRLSENRLSRSAVFLESLDRRGIIEAIIGPSRSERLRSQFGLTIEAGLPEIIADDLLEDRDSPIAPTLQILLTKMWDEAKKRNYSRPRFDLDLYQTLKKQGILLKDFLDQQLDKLRQGLPEVVNSGLALEVLAFHTTPQRTAEQRTKAELEQEYEHQKQVLPALVQQCQDLYLLVDAATKAAAPEPATRLAHDTLAHLVRQQFDESDKPGQRAARILENRSVEWQKERERAPLDEHDLKIVEDGKSGMRAWKDDEKRLIEASREQLEKNEKKRQTERIVKIALLWLIIIGAGLAVWQWRVAERQAAQATSRQLAAQARTYLDDQLDLALLLSLEALHTANTFEARNSLLTALQFNPRLTTFLQNPAQKRVNNLAFSPDGKIMAASYADSIIILWDVATRQPLGLPLKHHRGSVSVAFSADGKTLASAGFDKTIVLWNVFTHQPLGAPVVGYSDTLISVAFSPDGKTFASVKKDSNIILWDIVNRQPLGRPLKGHKDFINSLAFSADGKILASGSKDNTIILWDIASGRRIGQPLVGHRSWVQSVAFSPDGKHLASAGYDSTVILWDIHTRQLLHQLSGHQHFVLCVAFSADGKTVASGSGDNSIMLWDVLDGHGQPLAGHQNLPTDFISSVTFSPDGKTLATTSSSSGTILLWDITRSQSFGQSISGHQHFVSSVAFSPNGKILASGSFDKTIILWDVATHQPLGQPLIGHQKYVNSVAFSSDGDILASGSEDRNIILWDIATRQPIGQPLTGHRNSVSNVAFSPDGKLLASCSLDSSIILWDIASRQPLSPSLKGHRGQVYSIAFSPDGKILASGSLNEIILWDIATRFPLGKPLARDWMISYSLAFSPNGKTLASASSNGKIFLWEVATQQFLGQPLAGHSGAVNSVTFSPDGKTLASGSADKTIILWDLSAREPRGLFLTGHQSDVSSIAFSPDGKTLASGSWDNTIRLWDVSLESWRQRASTRANRNFSKEEWQLYMGDQPYRITCPDLLIDRLLAGGKNLARAGDIDGATANFQRAIELQPALKLDSKVEAKTLATQALIAEGQNFAENGNFDEAMIRYRKALALDPGLIGTIKFAGWSWVKKGERWARKGKIKQAMAAYEKAQKLDPSLKISADSWNNLCWYGSAWGRHAHEVVHACEQAVAMDSANGYFRDSRGVARALTGDFAGAIEDFQVFINGTKDKQAQLRREQWIEILKTRKNPFTPEELERLRKE